MSASDLKSLVFAEDIEGVDEWLRGNPRPPASELSERYLGLASVVVHTAGTHEAETTLSGLSIETARAVREQLTGETDDEADGV